MKNIFSFFILLNIVLSSMCAYNNYAVGCNENFIAFLASSLMWIVTLILHLTSFD